MARPWLPIEHDAAVTTVERQSLQTLQEMDNAFEPRIMGYHAHVYYDADSMPAAVALCEAAAGRFPLAMGRFHTRPVGPHPDWSCQLAFKATLFGEVVPWLMLNRNGLVVFVHPLTDQDLIDHRDRALWMGKVRPLDLSTL